MLAELFGGLGRISHIYFLAGQRLSDASLSSEGDLVADFQMAGDSYLASECDILTQSGATGNTDLTAKDTVLPNHHIVTDLHQIIDLGPSLDPSPAKTGPIDTGVGSNLHIIIHLHNSSLRNLHVLPSLELIAEAISPQNSATMKNDAIPDNAPLSDGDPGVKEAGGPHPGAVANITMGANDGAVADFRVLFNDGVGLDADAFAEFHARADDSGGVNAGRENDGRRRDLGEKLGERSGGIRAMDRGGADGLREIRGDEHGGGAAFPERGKVRDIREERDVARTRLGERGGPGDGGGTVRPDSKLATNHGGQL